MNIIASHQEMIADRYSLNEEVGQGGMATVFRGQDTVLGREIAVKILHPHLARESEHRQRFRREARTIARLQHPGIVEVYDFSDQESHDDVQQINLPVYLVMEFVEGQNLQALLDKQEFPLNELGAALVANIAEALAHAHHQQTIHRDLKPENVLIRADGTVKITDFGLARILDGEAITRTGSILGSPAYMAPEQIEGSLGNEQTDIFALGVILYRLTCRKHPFLRNNPAATLQAVSSLSYPDPENINPGMGKDLARIIRRALSLCPADRYASAQEMHGALLGYLSEVGFHHPQASLQRYLTDPNSSDKVTEEVLTQLKQRALTLSANKRYSAALDRCNRALAITPNDPDIEKIIERITNRKHWMQGPIGVSLAISLLLGIVLINYPPSWWASLLRPSSRRAVRLVPKYRDKTKPPKHLLKITSTPLIKRKVRSVAPKPKAQPPISIDVGWRWRRLRVATQVVAIRYRVRRRRPWLQIRGFKGGVVSQSPDQKKKLNKQREGFPLRGRPPYRLTMKLAKHKSKTFLLTPLARKKPRRRWYMPVPPPRPEPVPEAKETIPRKVMFLLDPYATIVATSGEEKIVRKTSRKHNLLLASERVWLIKATHPLAHTRQWKLLIPESGPPSIQELDKKGRPKHKNWTPIPYSPRDSLHKLAARMKIKAALIRISSSVSNAILVINGKITGYLSKEPQRFSIPWRWRSSRKKIEVTVSHEGYKEWTKILILKPGSIKIIPKVKLRPLKGRMHPLKKKMR